MQRGLSAILIFLSVTTTASLAQSQSADSLGDLARANRAKQQAQEAAGIVPKTITNQDLPAAAPGIPESASSEPMTTVSGVKKMDRYADQRLSSRLQGEQRAAEQWKARIQAQGDRIADLQARIDRVNASIHNAVGTAQYDTPANRYQTIQMERLARMQETLEQEKRRLASMEDAARRAGMDQ